VTSPDVALPGRRFPFGATVRDGGTNFAVAAADADGMVLSLFDGDGGETQVPLLDYDAGVWHGFVPGVGGGQAYGYRATGRYDPGAGLRFNPAKLLLDPYARALHGAVRFGPEILGHAAGDPDTPSPLDSAAYVPRSLVVADDGSRRSDAPRPWHAYADTVIYEVHVKGFTMRHPGVPAQLRGTCAGLGHEAAIEHLVDLGVTTVELLPVHESVPEEFLPQRGQTNYWGYNRRQRFLAGADAADLGWYTPAGTAMTTANWADSNARAVAIYLDGSDAPDRTADGSPLIDDDFLVLVSAWWEPLAFTIPAVRADPTGHTGRTGQTWHAEIDSYDPARPTATAGLQAGDQLTVQPRSIVVLRSPLPASTS